MFKGLNRFVLGALVAGATFAAVLVAPMVASADCGGGPSAVHVYSECVPSGGGGKHSNGPPTTSQQGTPNGKQNKPPVTPPVSSRASKALAKAGPRDKAVLSNLVKNPGLGASPGFSAHGSDTGSAPSTLAAAFDLGAGPLALLIVLAGTAVLLIGGSGVRLWRHRHIV